jgi:hypothetical protein
MSDAAIEQRYVDWCDRLSKEIVGWRETVTAQMHEIERLRADQVEIEGLQKKLQTEIERLQRALRASESLKAGYFEEIERLKSSIAPFADAAKLEEEIKRLHGMTAKFSHNLPPLPWSYQIVTAYTGSIGFIYIVDATGRKIASLWGKPQEKEAMAELICDASDRAVGQPK